MMTRSTVPRVRRIESYYQLFRPAETFRSTPRSTSEKARELKRKKYVRFTPKATLTPWGRTRYYLQYGSPRAWDELPLVKRQQLVRRIITQLNPRGRVSVAQLVERLRYLSEQLETKAKGENTNLKEWPPHSTQFAEGILKKIRLFHMAIIYVKIAQGVAGRKIDFANGKFNDNST